MMIHISNWILLGFCFFYSLEACKSKSYLPLVILFTLVLNLFAPYFK